MACWPTSIWTEAGRVRRARIKLSRRGRDATILKLSLNIESKKAMRSGEIVGEDAEDVILVRRSLRSWDLACWLEFDSIEVKAAVTSDDAISVHSDMHKKEERLALSFGSSAQVSLPCSGGLKL